MTSRVKVVRSCRQSDAGFPVTTHKVAETPKWAVRLPMPRLTFYTSSKVTITRPINAAVTKISNIIKVATSYVPSLTCVGPQLDKEKFHKHQNWQEGCLCHGWHCNQFQGRRSRSTQIIPWPKMSHIFGTGRPSNLVYRWSMTICTDSMMTSELKALGGWSSHHLQRAGHIVAAPQVLSPL